MNEYKCSYCGARVQRKRRMPTGWNVECEKCRKTNNAESTRAARYRHTMKGGRLEALVVLYKRLETWLKTAEAPKGELLELASAFADLRAPCHVKYCERLYQEQP